MRRYDAPPSDWDCSILLSRIPRSGEPYVESCELPMDGVVEHWGQTYTFRDPIRTEITANYASERILVQIAVQANFSLPCSRCLSETGLAITGVLRYLFTLRPSRDGKETDEDEASERDGVVDVIPVDNFQAELNLAPYVWEALLLNLPERALCSESCKGLCPTCGCNRSEKDCGCKEDNVDPRLAVLRNFQATEPEDRDA